MCPRLHLFAKILGAGLVQIPDNDEDGIPDDADEGKRTNLFAINGKGASPLHLMALRWALHFEAGSVANPVHNGHNLLARRRGHTLGISNLGVLNELSWSRL
jgi:hypothetical protein